MSNLNLFYCFIHHAPLRPPSLGTVMFLFAPVCARAYRAAVVFGVTSQALFIPAHGTFCTTVAINFSCPHRSSPYGTQIHPKAVDTRR